MFEARRFDSNSAALAPRDSSEPRRWAYRDDRVVCAAGRLHIRRVLRVERAAAGCVGEVRPGFGAEPVAQLAERGYADRQVRACGSTNEEISLYRNSVVGSRFSSGTP